MEKLGYDDMLQAPGARLWAAKATYALWNMGQASILSFIPLFFQELGYSKAQLGILLALPCACAVLGAPFWCYVADQFDAQRLVHIFCVVSGSGLLFAQYFVEDFRLMCVLVVAANLQMQATAPLLDQAVLDLIDKVGGEYGKQRLFGALGYGLGAFVTGKIVAASSIQWAFNMLLLFSAASLLTLHFLPSPKSKKPNSGAAAGGGVDEVTGLIDGAGLDDLNPPAPSMFTALRLVLRKSDVVLLFVTVLVMGLMLGVIASYLTLYLFNLSGSSVIMGVSVACETSSEIPAFFFANQIIQRFGIVFVLLLGVAGLALRITWYAVLSNAWLVLPVEFLHGITFSLVWTASTQYVYRASPLGLEGTTIGLLSMVQSGLGKGAATLLGGAIYGQVGPKQMWFYADLLNVPALLGIAGFWYFKLRAERAPQRRRESACKPYLECVSPMSPGNCGSQWDFLPRSVSGDFKSLLDNTESADLYGSTGNTLDDLGLNGNSNSLSASVSASSGAKNFSKAWEGY